MCLIEEIGYTAENREQYCTTCVIFNQIRQCVYLKQCETNFNKDTFVNINKIGSEELVLNNISRGDELCVCKKELGSFERSW